MIAIIDYNAGNIASVQNVLDRFGFEYTLTADLVTIKQASHIILPGQGRAGMAMEELKKRNLIDVIKNCQQPFLGICLGMQVLSNWSEEDDTECLGIIPGEVKLFSTSVKIPHMGWNNLHFEQNSPIFRDIPQDSYFYFVHSFYFETEPKYNLATASYGQTFSAVVGRDNYYATQFHPEKSGDLGEKMLRNFCEIKY